MLFRHNLLGVVKIHTRSLLNHEQEDKIHKRAAVGAERLNYRILEEMWTGLRVNRQASLYLA